MDWDGDEREGGQGEEEIKIHVEVVLLRHQHLVDDPEGCEGEGLGKANTSHNNVGIFSREKVERLQQSVLVDLLQIMDILVASTEL